MVGVDPETLGEGGPPVSLPRYPALHQSVPGAPGRRLARALLAFLLQALLGILATAILGFTDLGRAWGEWQRTAVGLTGGALLAAAINLIGVAAVGRGLPDLILRLRHVRVDSGLAPGWRAFPRGAVMGLLMLLTAGVVPVIIVVATRDEDGRYWHDRWSGIAVLDLRLGRDPVERPVGAAELAVAFGDRRPSGPAIVIVNPEPAARQSPFVDAATSRMNDPGVGALDLQHRTSASSPSPGGDAPPQVFRRLRFDIGGLHSVSGPALVGRSPAAHRRFPEARLIPLEDPSRTVSSTHLAVTPNDLGVWVEDLGSTNGSELVSQHGRVRPIPAGVRTAVPLGATVRLGDRTMRVE